MATNFNYWDTGNNARATQPNWAGVGGVGGTGVGIPGHGLGYGAPGQRNTQLPQWTPWTQTTHNGQPQTGIAGTLQNQPPPRVVAWTRDANGNLVPKVANQYQSPEQKLWQHYSNPNFYDPMMSPLVHGAQATNPNWHHNQPTIYGSQGNWGPQPQSTPSNMPGGTGGTAPVTGGNLAGGPGGAATGGTDHDYTQRQWRDPRSTAAYEFLESVVRGETGPYDDAAKNNMRSLAAKMNTAAAAQQGEALRNAPGANLRDPSMNAAMQGIEGRRQGANMDAALQIENQAVGQNHAARVQAADILGRYDYGYGWSGVDMERILDMRQDRAQRAQNPWMPMNDGFTWLNTQGQQRQPYIADAYRRNANPYNIGGFGI